jgi:hypothetical protein
MPSELYIQYFVSYKELNRENKELNDFCAVYWIIIARSYNIFSLYLIVIDQVGKVALTSFLQ